ncbi:MAG: serine/threonine protein kinase [Planctomycetes bacterium]|nr:serine/threonine protein kinase [Planctomycetota bacterium]
MSLDARDVWLGSEVLNKGLAPRGHLLSAARKRAAGDARSLSEILVAGGVLTEGQVARLAALAGDFSAKGPPPAWLEELSNPPEAPPRRRRGSGALLRRGDAKADGVETLIDSTGALGVSPKRGARPRSGNEGGAVKTLLGAAVIPVPGLDGGARSEGHGTVKLQPPSPKGAQKEKRKPSARPKGAGSGSASRRSRQGKPETLGGYEVLEEIGRGGMGVVYRGRAPSLDRECAIKVRVSSSNDLREICRFQNEAVLSARLRHPNIVGVLHAGEEEGRLYLVMEYVEGVTFTRWIEEHATPADLRVGLGVVIGAADALAYAHTQAVIHRDVKPENILVTAEGEARITDFGLARGAGVHLDLTLEGQALGTLNYAPPEQANGELERIGPRSDVYGLGATLYHLLSGDAPYSEDEGLSVFYKVLRGLPLPKPSGLAEARGRAPVASPLDWICAKAMEPDAQDRYATPADLADDLRAFLEGRPIQAQPAGTGHRLEKFVARHRARLAGASVLAGVLLLGFTASFGVAQIQANEAARALVRQDERAALEHADSIVRAVQVDMLTGRADLARKLARDLGAEGGPSVEIARTDGTLAYRDNSTRKAVAARLAEKSVRAEGERRFPELAVAIDQLETFGGSAGEGEAAPVRLEVDSQAWTRVLRGGKPLSYTRGEGDDSELVVLYPLLNAERCQVCHGEPQAYGRYQENKVRGVVVVRRSQSQMRVEMAQASRRARIAGLVTALITGCMVLVLVRALGLRSQDRIFGVATPPPNEVG